MKLSDKLKKGELIKTGVFLGGASSEKEISLESGRHIYNSLNRSKYDIIPIFVDEKLNFWQIPEALLWMNTTADIARSLEPYNAQRIPYDKLPDIIELAVISALHGKWGEDGCLQGLLEILNIPYTGTGILSSALGNDKIKQREVLKAYGLNVPKSIYISQKDWQADQEGQLEKILSTLKFPMVTKPPREGCSTAVAKVNNKEELIKGINNALKWDPEALIEEFIEGIEITCTILGNNDDDIEALTPTQTPSKADILSLEEKFLPGDARMLTPPPTMTNKEIEFVKKEFIKAYKALQIKVYARIDAFWTKDKKLIILEPNTLPGVTPSTMVFHQAAEKGWSPTEFFDRIIDLSIKAHEDKIGPK